MSLVPVSCGEMLLIDWQLEFYLNVHLSFFGLPCFYVCMLLEISAFFFPPFCFLNVYQKDSI